MGGTLVGPAYAGNGMVCADVDYRQMPAVVADPQLLPAKLLPEPVPSVTTSIGALPRMVFPEMSVIRELARGAPECRCVVLTLHEDDTHLFDALGAGAVGFLVKGTDREGIERAVRSAAVGQIVLGTEVAGRVTSAAGAARPRPGGEAFPALSDRELELLDLLSAGLDNTAIDQALVLAPKTIRNQVSALLDKLAVTDRAEAIRLGRSAGLGGRGLRR